MTRSSAFKGLWAAGVAVARRATTAATGAAGARPARRSSSACRAFAEFLDDRLRLADWHDAWRPAV